MRALLIVVATVLAVGCAAPAASPAPSPSSGPVSARPAASASTSADPEYPALTPAATPTPAPSVSFKAGDWPPAFQKFICEARAQMLREDALAGGIPGQDAATRALELMKSAPNWEPAVDFRALLGKAGFVMLDASPRGGDFLKDIVDANAAFEAAYEELKSRTGFECPS